MKNIVICLMVAIVGCAMESEPTADQKSDVLTPDLAWMIGQWDCRSNYHNVAPFKARSELATYTFTAGLDGSVHGEYTPETSSTTVTSKETWTIGTEVDGEAPVGISLTMSDGSFSASATGTIDGAISGTTILGFSSLTGTIAFPGKATKTWHTGMFATSGPDEISVNSFLGSPTSFQLYLDTGCTRRPAVDPTAIHLPSAQVDTSTKQNTGGVCTLPSAIGGGDVTCNTDWQPIIDATVPPPEVTYFYILRALYCGGLANGAVTCDIIWDDGSRPGLGYETQCVSDHENPEMISCSTSPMR